MSSLKTSQVNYSRSDFLWPKNDSISLWGAGSYTRSVMVEMKEIYAHLQSLEADKLPSPGYLMDGRFSDEMLLYRRMLVDWLINVHVARKLKPRTIFLAVNILDRFLEKTGPVSTEKLQLVGATCLVIASKYEDVDILDMVTMEEICADKYSIEELIEMESCICNALQFRFTLSTPVDFAQLYLRDTIEDLTADTYGFMLLSLLQHKCLEYKPSEIALMSLKMTYMKHGLEWRAPLEIKESEECLNAIYNIYRPERDQLKEDKDAKVSYVSKLLYKEDEKLKLLAAQMLK